MSIEADAVIHPFTVLRGRTVVSPRTPRSGRTPSSSMPTIGADALVGPFCYLRPGTVLAARAKAGTFVELKNAHIGEARRCRISRTSAMPRSGRARTSAPAPSPRTTRTSPVGEKHRTTIGRNVQDGQSQCLRGSCDDRRRCMDRRRLVHHRGRSARRARDRAGATGRQGGLRCVETGTTELALPGPRRDARARPQPRGERGRWIERGPSGEADALRRALAPRAGAARSPTSSTSSSATSKLEDVRQRRDLLPLQGVDPRRRRLHRPVLPRPGDERLPLGAARS